jgi:hypothetical protein
MNFPPKPAPVGAPFAHCGGAGGRSGEYTDSWDFSDSGVHFPAGVLV